MNRSADFDTWKERAREQDLLSVAASYGAVLKRFGREHIGPCPACGGKDKFGVNPTRGVFVCRGAAGGDAIAMAQHLGGLSFTQACEHLTGEPPPGRQATPLTREQQDANRKRREDSQRAQQQREVEEAAHTRKRLNTAAQVWKASVPITGTESEFYLLSRGLPVPPGGWPDSLRHHPALPYELESRLTFPCLVCRVEGPDGKGRAVWRIYLSADGTKKAPVDKPKLGLGPAAGGAVRLGGAGPRIGVAEGVETALAVWALVKFKHPVWAALSTSGMAGLELPGYVKEARIFPDGDAPLRRRGASLEPAVPAGRKAAFDLRGWLSDRGVTARVMPEPACGNDYLDLWCKSAGVAA